MNGLAAKNIASLCDCATLAAGYPFRGKIDAMPNGNVAVIQMRNADPQSGIDWSSLSRIALPRPSQRSLLGNGDIILSTRGGRNFAYFINYLNEPVVCSPHFFVIRVKKSDLLPEFLAWQLNQRPAQEHFATGATGSYILNLKREVLENLPIVVPPIEAQNKIIQFSALAHEERVVLNNLMAARSSEMLAISKLVLAPASKNREEK